MKSIGNSFTAFAILSIALLSVGGTNLSAKAIEDRSTPSPIAAAPSNQAQNIIVHLKHDTEDLHAVFMALKMAKSLQDRGAKVTLLLTLEGVRIADARQPQNLRWGSSETQISELYDAFVKAGGKVMVCPVCAAAAGLDEKSLRPGAQFAMDSSLVDMIISADKLLDY